jgi:hypothetical protein
LINVHRMPNPWHDAITTLLTENPDLGLTILRRCGVADLPCGLSASVGSRAFNDRVSKDFYADAVLVVGGRPHDPVCGLIVEAQAGMEGAKPGSWPRYAAAHWLQTGKPTYVMAVFRDQQVADWYAERNPITTTLPGYRLEIIIVGPAQIPAITDPVAVAADLALGTLSFAAHGDDPAVASAFTTTLAKLPVETLQKYCGLAYGMSAAALRDLLEVLVETDVHIASPFQKLHYGRGLADGEVKGEAKSIIRVLQRRGLVPTDAEREQIAACADAAQLDVWLDRALTARSVSDLFRD